MNWTGDIPACNPCGRAREANKAWHANDFERRRQAKAAAAALRDNCSRCGGTNTYEDEAGDVRKCNHQEAM
jgi:hypothetical protein